MNDHPLDQIVLYVEGELPDPQEIRRHLEECPSCRRYAEECRSLAQEVSAPESEADFSDLLRRFQECDALAEALTVHASGEEDPEVSRHLATCLRCSDQARAMQALGGDLRTLGASRATFASLGLRPSWRPLFVCAAAVLIAVGVVGLLLRLPRGPNLSAPPLAAEDPLEELLRASDDEARSIGARLPGEDPRVLWSIAESLRHPSDTARAYAAVRILRYAGAEDFLVRAMGREEFLDRMIAQALVEIDSRRAIPWLLRELEDSELRPRALEDLARLRDPSTIGALARHLPSRPRVGELLARFPVKDLVAAAARDPWFVAVPVAEVHAALLERPRAETLEAAIRSGPVGAEFLIRASKSVEARRALERCPRSDLGTAVARALRSDELRPLALEVIRDRKLTRFLPELKSAAGSGQREVLPILARIADDSAADFLIRLLADDRHSKAAAAALALVEGARLARRAQTFLRNPRLARPLVAVLSGWDRKELGPFFVRALRISETRASAFAALGRMRYREAVPSLLPFVRADARAREALVEITGQDFGRDRHRWDRWWRKNS